MKNEAWCARCLVLFHRSFILENRKNGRYLKKNLAGDWMNHLAMTVLPCEAAGFERSDENPHRTPIDPNQRWFRHKHVKLKPDMMSSCVILWCFDLPNPAASPVNDKWRQQAKRTTYGLEENPWIFSSSYYVGKRPDCSRVLEKNHWIPTCCSS